MNAYYDGQFMPLEEVKIPVLDRGFIFGDGVYEVIPVYDRRAFRLDGHLARLRRSLAEIRITNPHSDEAWAQLIQDLINRQPNEQQAIYLQVTRGVAKRDHAFPKDTPPTVFMMSNPLTTPAVDQVQHGVSAVTLTDNRWFRCDIKTTALLANVLLKQDAVDAGGSEAVLFRDGYLTEGTSSNIFAVKNGTIHTPPKSHLLLPGITYDVIVDLARIGDIPLEQRDVSAKEVRTADELWLTSSMREVLAITTLDNTPVGNGAPGPIFKRIHQLYQEHKRAHKRAAA